MTFLLYALLVTVASFNRETSILIIGIYAAYHGRTKLKEVILLLVLWGLITGGIHLAVGEYPHMLGASGTLALNLSNLPDALVANILLLPLAYLAITEYSTAPPLLKRLVWVEAVYVLAIIVGGSWQESQRLVLPVLPIFLPLIIRERHKPTASPTSLRRTETAQPL